MIILMQLLKKKNAWKWAKGVVCFCWRQFSNLLKGQDSGNNLKDSQRREYDCLRLLTISVAKTQRPLHAFAAHEFGMELALRFLHVLHFRKETQWRLTFWKKFNSRHQQFNTIESFQNFHEKHQKPHTPPPNPATAEQFLLQCQENVAFAWTSHGRLGCFTEQNEGAQRFATHCGHVAAWRKGSVCLGENANFLIHQMVWYPYPRQQMVSDLSGGTGSCFDFRRSPAAYFMFPGGLGLFLFVVRLNALAKLRKSPKSQCFYFYFDARRGFNVRQWQCGVFFDEEGRPISKGFSKGDRGQNLNRPRVPFLERQKPTTSAGSLRSAFPKKAGGYPQTQGHTHPQSQRCAFLECIREAIKHWKNTTKKQPKTTNEPQKTFLIDKPPFSKQDKRRHLKDTTMKQKTQQTVTKKKTRAPDQHKKQKIQNTKNNNRTHRGNKVANKSQTPNAHQRNQTYHQRNIRKQKQN